MGDIYHDLYISGVEFFWGYILAVIIAIPFGREMMSSKVGGSKSFYASVCAANTLGQRSFRPLLSIQLFCGTCTGSNSKSKHHPDWLSYVEPGISGYEKLFARFGGSSRGSRKISPLFRPKYSREAHLSRNDNAILFPAAAAELLVPFSSPHARLPRRTAMSEYFFLAGRSSQ